MKTRRILALIMALVLICCALSACGSKNNEETGSGSKDYKSFTLDDWKAEAEKIHSEGKDKYNILYIPSWAASEYFVNSFEAWKELYEGWGWTCEMIGPTNYTAADQINVLESALTSHKYDGIILYPIDGNSFAAVKDEMWDTYHTPIVCWGMPESSGAGQYYIMGDDRYKLVGEAMAEMAIEYVDANMDYFSKFEGKGIPTYYGGAASNSNQNVRVLRAKELLEADGRFKTVHYEENIAENKATEFAETMLMNYPDVEILIMYNDVFCFNFDNAMESSGTKVSDHLGMFGCDGIKAAAALMKEQGDKCRIKGSALSNHKLVGTLAAECFKVGIPAAKQGIIVEGITEECVNTFKTSPADSELGANSIKLTPANVNTYFPDL